MSWLRPSHLLIYSLLYRATRSSEASSRSDVDNGRNSKLSTSFFPHWDTDHCKLISTPCPCHTHSLVAYAMGIHVPRAGSCHRQCPRDVSAPPHFHRGCSSMDPSGLRVVKTQHSSLTGTRVMATLWFLRRLDAGQRVAYEATCCG